MINLLEMVKIKWTTRNKSYYQSKGYQFTSIGDQLNVYIKDLPQNSNTRVPVYCDCEVCSDKRTITPYRNYNKLVKQNGLYRCKSCVHKLNIKKRTEKSHKRLYNLFLQKCSEHECVPLTTFQEFYGCNTYMRYICPVHGETGTYMNNISCQNAWCRECGYDSLSQNMSLSPDEVKKRVESKNNNILLNPYDYMGSNVKNLKIVCGRCHNVFITSLSSIMVSKGMCYKCGNFVGSHTTTYSKDDVVQMVTINNQVMVVNPEDYINMASPLQFICSECGKTFITTPNNYIKRGFQRCNQCHLYSQGQQIIAQVLDRYEIRFIRQMRFDDCKDTKTLPFDFYLPDYNLLIEFNGEQHYKPIDYFGGNKQLEYVQKHDRIKNEYALSNGYDILTIVFNDQDDIENILKNKIRIT